jgi:putative Mg2+ transporter-C (MgtC) family protein
MTMSIEQAAINLAVAFLLSAAIGFERQWRNRLAGLRTNTLVALGAASFVVFAALVPGEASPTRVAAQVVSGIGFLGAGLIFREGMSVRGLNTAATLWCSAASASSPVGAIWPMPRWRPDSSCSSTFSYGRSSVSSIDSH